MKRLHMILLLTAITTALMAGLFFSWPCSIIPGLGRLPDAEYIAAMQSINRAIQNPVFFAAFFGTALLLPLSTYISYEQPVPTRFWLLLAASLIYIIGVIGVTAGGNIPLNEALDAFNVRTASVEDIARQRTIFEAPWIKLNSIRVIAAVLSLVLVIIACLNQKKLIG